MPEAGIRRESGACEGPGATARRRLLVVGHTYVEQTAQRKLDALARRGLDVAVLVPDRWAMPRNGLFAGVVLKPSAHYSSFQLFTSPVLRSGHMASFVLSPLAIAGVLRKFHPEIVQIEQETYSFAAAQVSLAASRRGARVVLFGAENLDRELPLSQRLARRIALGRSNVVLSCNEAGMALARKAGFERPTHVVPLQGIDTLAFSPALRSTRAPSASLTIGYVGRLVPEKGIDTLLRALAMVRRRDGCPRLKVTGSGPMEPALRDLAGKLGVAGAVDWMPSVPNHEVPTRMAAIDVLVLPSRDTPAWQEQFGLVLAQAMSMGIPVVGSRSGAIPEVIGRDDLLFPQNDHEALAAILTRLMDSPEEREALSAWGIERVRRLYSVDAVADRLVSLYDRLLERPWPV